MTRAEYIMDKISDVFGADKTTPAENLETLEQLQGIIANSIKSLKNELKERS